jgi:hypothetical protein
MAGAELDEMRKYARRFVEPGPWSQLEPVRGNERPAVRARLGHRHQCRPGPLRLALQAHCIAD